METNFSWLLGTETNNIDEALAPWQGLLIAKDQRITSLSVLGDLIIVIQALVEGSLPNHQHLSQLIKKIQSLACSFHKIDFFHVLRTHNKDADLVANSGTVLIVGSLLINGSYYLCPIA